MSKGLLSNGRNSQEVPGVSMNLLVWPHPSSDASGIHSRWLSPAGFPAVSLRCRTRQFAKRRSPDRAGMAERRRHDDVYNKPMRRYPVSGASVSQRMCCAVPLKRATLWAANPCVHSSHRHHWVLGASAHTRSHLLLPNSGMRRAFCAPTGKPSCLVNLCTPPAQDPYRPRDTSQDMPQPSHGIQCSLWS